MKLLLDTHAIVWALQDSPQLPPYIVDMICDERNEIYVSVASLWEISIKNKKNPNRIPFSATEIRDFCQRAGYIFLSVSVDSISTFDKTVFADNNDPFDQLLISQSIANNMKLITHDKKIEAFKIGNVELF